MSNFNEVTPLYYWVQKVLPLVYDDSLSYYELLNKVVKKLNDLIKNNSELPAYIQSLIESYITSGDIEQVISDVISNFILNVKYPPTGLIPAVGNGTADDTTAIQQCIDYAFSHGGMAVYFPSGSYLTNSLTIKTNVSLTGFANTSTKLILKGGATKELINGICDNICIYNLTLDGKSGTQVNNIDVLSLKGSNIFLQNLIVLNGYNGVVIDSTGDVNINETIINNIVIDGIVTKGNGTIQVDSLHIKTLSQISGRYPINNTVNNALFKFYIESQTNVGIYNTGNNCAFIGKIINTTTPLINTGENIYYNFYEKGSTEKNLILTEIENRENSDTNLQISINNEKDDRIEADAALQNQIDNLQPKTTGAYANVKNYGAIGDGITDDSQAINNAFADNNFIGVFFPKGDYNLNNNVLNVTKSMRGIGVYSENNENGSRIIGEVNVSLKKSLIIEEFICNKLTFNGAWYLDVRNIKVIDSVYIGGYSQLWGFAWNSFTNIVCSGFELDNGSGFINQNIYTNIHSKNSATSMSANLWLHGDTAKDLHGNTFINCDFSLTSSDKYAVLNECNQPNTLIQPYVEDLFNPNKDIKGNWIINEGTFDIAGTPLPSIESFVIGTISAKVKTGEQAVAPRVGNYLPISLTNLFTNGDLKQQMYDPAGTVPGFNAFNSIKWLPVYSDTIPNPYGICARQTYPIGTTNEGLTFSFYPKSNFNFCTATIIYKGEIKALWSVTNGVETYYKNSITSDSNGWSIISFKMPTILAYETTLNILGANSTPTTTVTTLDIARINIVDGIVGTYGLTSSNSTQVVTGAPTVGKWIVGDFVRNYDMVNNGSIYGWVCSVSGTPGTWVPVGIIGATRATAQPDSTATDIAGLKNDFNSLLAKLRNAKLMY